MNPLDPSSVVPFRATSPFRSSWREGLAGKSASAAVSLAVHLAAVAGLVRLAFPKTDAVPQAISVELLPKMPSPRAAEEPKPQSAPASPASAESPQGKDDVKAAGNSAEPTPDATSSNAASAEAKPAPDAPQAAAGMPSGDHPPPAPPPVEDKPEPKPQLVAAPADPRHAAQQTEKPVSANAEEKPAETPHPAERPPAPAPPTIAAQVPTPESAPPPASTSQDQPPAPAETAEQRREAENTAKLAAALPFSQSFSLDPNRAALSGSGETPSQQYRGEVYGAFHKADDLVAAAQAKRLRGQAVVEFSIDDHGALTALRVAISSGNPAVDETALDIIRRSAPFPPPPPGGQHTFSPAIALGLDD